jgi:hypothetical protein
MAAFMASAWGIKATNNRRKPKGLSQVQIMMHIFMQIKSQSANNSLHFPRLPFSLN